MDSRSQLFRLFLTLLALGKSHQKCEYVHDRCAFVVSTGRSGSTAVLGAMNQVDGIFIRGENDALFNNVESLYNLIKVLSVDSDITEDAETKYLNYIQKKKPDWFNAFPHQDADCISKYIFKYLYGSGKFDDYIVGYKEIRFLPTSKPVMEWRSGHPQRWKPIHTTSYEIFTQRLEFLKSLCNQPQIVFNMRKNTSATMHSSFYKRHKNTAKAVPEVSEWIVRYHREHLDDTFMVYYEDMYDETKNSTLAKHLLQFLRVDADKQNVTFASVKPSK